MLGFRPLYTGLVSNSIIGYFEHVYGFKFPSPIYGASFKQEQNYEAYHNYPY